jgi:type VI protein secretion system component VasK
MNWNTAAMAGGTVLLAWALGGVRGLLVMIALIVFYWLLRSINIAGAAHDEERSEERTARREADRKAEQERQSQQRRRQAEQECETERLRQRQSKRAVNHSEENEWWSVLGVPPMLARMKYVTPTAVR